MIYDVIICGSGVAGSTAAYFLAESGFKILVIEKEKLPRYKTCGGGVVFRAAQALPFDISPVTEKLFYKTDIYDFSNKLRFVIERKRPIVYLTMRENLDYFILQKAIAKGAEVVDQFSVAAISIDKDTVTIKSGTSEFKTKFLIAADGAISAIARLTSFNSPKLKAPALEYEVGINDSDHFKKLSASWRFDFGILESGYCWVFPKKDHLSVGIAAMRKKNSSLKEYLEKYLIQLKINGKIDKIEKYGFVIPVKPCREYSFGERVLFTGDTIGLADPILAEGISNSIESGKAAAQAILEGKFSPAASTSFYRRRIRKIADDLKYARFLGWFVYASPRIRSFVFKHYGNKIAELLTDVMVGDRNYSGVVTNPLNYLKLLKPEYLFGRDLKIKTGSKEDLLTSHI
jgi:geranylgeranyl reductase family protein